MTVVAQIFINSLFAFAFLGLATFGITIIFKTSSTTNFAQGIIGVIGAYVTSYLLLPAGVPNMDPNPFVVPDFSATFILPLLAGIACSFVFGFLIEMVIFRHSKYSNAATKQIITMGLVILISGLLPLIFDGTIRRQSYPISTSTISFLGIVIKEHDLTVFIASVVIISLIFVLLKFTKWGLGVRTVASNESVARLMGVNSHRVNALSWGIAGALGALSAISITAQMPLLSGVMAPTQINAFYSSIIGGFGTFSGPLAGAAIFTFIDSAVRTLSIGTPLSEWSTIIMFLVIMLMILLRPFGLFGKKIVRKV
jgi:branched-chain amino acid transport system permease protein